MVRVLGPGFACLDAGAHGSLSEVSSSIEVIMCTMLVKCN